MVIMVVLKCLIAWMAHIVAFLNCRQTNIKSRQQKSAIQREFKWNHSTKPSRCEVRLGGELIFAGAYEPAVQIYEALSRPKNKS